MIKSEWQMSMIDFMKNLNGCDTVGVTCGDCCIEYPSKTGTPLRCYIHHGRHDVPKEALPIVVAFLKAQRKP